MANLHLQPKACMQQEAADLFFRPSTARLPSAGATSIHAAGCSLLGSLRVHGSRGHGAPRLGEWPGGIKPTKLLVQSPRLFQRPGGSTCQSVQLPGIRFDPLPVVGQLPPAVVSTPPNSEVLWHRRIHLGLGGIIAHGWWRCTVLAPCPVLGEDSPLPCPSGRQQPS